MYKRNHQLGIQAYLNWYTSKSPLPPTEDEMLDRDPEWDNFVRTIGTLIWRQVEKLGGID